MARLTNHLAPAMRRFWDQTIVRPDPSLCWAWLGTTNTQGYGRMMIDGKNYYVHRLSYEWFCGPLARGRVIDHLCRNASCVNPRHLELVTVHENTIRGDSFAAVNFHKTHCAYGHPLSGDNLRRSKHRNERLCLTCYRRRNRQDRARRTARIRARRAALAQHRKPAEVTKFSMGPYRDKTIAVHYDEPAEEQSDE